MVGEADRGGAVVIMGLQRRDHGPADVPDLGIVQDAFEAVADFDEVMAVLNGDEHEDAAVGTLLANLPLVFQAIGEVGLVVAVKVLKDDDGDLGVELRRVVKLAAQAVKTGDGFRRQNVGEVGNVVGGLG